MRSRRLPRSCSTTRCRVRGWWAARRRARSRWPTGRRSRSRSSSVPNAASAGATTSSTTRSSAARRASAAACTIRRGRATSRPTTRTALCCRPRCARSRASRRRGASRPPKQTRLNDEPSLRLSERARARIERALLSGHAPCGTALVTSAGQAHPSASSSPPIFSPPALWSLRAPSWRGAARRRGVDVIQRPTTSRTGAAPRIRATAARWRAAAARQDVATSSALSACGRCGALGSAPAANDRGDMRSIPS
eukprot:2890605-Prymnesium_polylepis.1